MKLFLIAAAAFVAATPLVASQALSAQCTAALTNILASPDAACLNPNGLLGIALTPQDMSIIPNVNSWLTGFCAVPACTNASISNILTAVASGCATDLAAAGVQLDSVTLNEIITDVQGAFPAVREILCLTKTSSTPAQFCVTETLTNLEAVVGPLTLTSIGPDVQMLADQGMIPSSVLCTDCNKESFNIARTQLPFYDADVIDPKLAAECGNSFTDKQDPTGISMAAVTATPTPTTTPGPASAAASASSAAGSTSSTAGSTSSSPVSGSTSQRSGDLRSASLGVGLAALVSVAGAIALLA
jgi:hypothetical protein